MKKNEFFTKALKLRGKQLIKEVEEGNYEEYNLPRILREMKAITRILDELEMTNLNTTKA